jgi:hypothetical protein
MKWLYDYKARTLMIDRLRIYVTELFLTTYIFTQDVIYF